MSSRDVPGRVAAMRVMVMISNPRTRHKTTVAHPKSEASVAMSSQRGQDRRFAVTVSAVSVSETNAKIHTNGWRQTNRTAWLMVVAFVNDRAPIGIPSAQNLFLLHPVRNLCCAGGKVWDRCAARVIALHPFPARGRKQLSSSSRLRGRISDHESSIVSARPSGFEPLT